MFSKELSNKPRCFTKDCTSKISGTNPVVASKNCKQTVCYICFKKLLKPLENFV